MYTVSKGPSKIVAKSRRGLSQNYEKFETIKESSKKSSDYNSPEKISTAPRPVFQTTKKSQIHARQLEEEHISPQHEELIKYVSDSWNMVVAQNPYDATCTTATTTTTAMTNGHAKNPDSNNNNCSNYDKSAALSSVSSSVVYKQNGSCISSSSSNTTGSNSSLSSISTVSSACTSPATSPQPSTHSPHSPPVTTTTTTSTTLYCVEPPSPVLKDFKPFDLEAWWGRRLFNNITKTI